MRSIWLWRTRRSVVSARWHFGYLDSLRGIAVLAVVMVHSSMRDNIQISLSETLKKVTGTGQRGVALFFIVSAFTLFLSFDNRKDETTPTLNFFIRRFFRLAPMMYVGMTVTYLFLRQYMGTRFEIAASALFVGGFHPLAISAGTMGGWSIADEAIFYACLPFLFVRIRKLSTAIWWVTAGMVVGTLLTRLLCHVMPQYTGFFEFSAFTAQFPIFLMGIAGYFAWKELMQRVDKRKELSIMLLVLAAVFYKSLLPFHYSTMYQESLIGLLLLLSVALHPWALFVNSVTRFMGKISYSIYILHFFPCVYLQRAVSGSPVTRFLLCFWGTLAVTVPLAYINWRWIEKPGISVGRKLIDYLNTKKRASQLVA
jgi:peptidoglycan/LPS O-acetylase OafA/YrhL